MKKNDSFASFGGTEIMNMVDISVFLIVLWLFHHLHPSSIDFGIYLHVIFHLVFTFTVQSPQNLRSNPYNRKSENGS